MFQILSDGSCDLSWEQLRTAGLDIVPFYVSLDGETYRKEMTELDVHDFYEYCVRHPDIFPKTSMPAVQDYADVFERYAKRGTDVLCYCLTEKFSGSFASAHTAAEMVSEKYPERKIVVADSTLVTGLQGLLLLELSRYAREGHSLEETYARGEEIKTSAAIYFTIGNLAYLSRGGRIGRLADQAMKGLNLRPIIRFGSGEIFPAGLSRGRLHSYTKVTDIIRKVIKNRGLDPEHYSFALGWGYSREEAEPFFEQIRALFMELFGRVPDFVPIQIGAAIGVHTGPHPVGMGFIQKA